MTPVSLLAYIMVMSIVSSRMLFFSSPRSIMPSALTSKYVTSKPSLARYLQVFKTAGCSTFVVIMWLPFFRFA